MDLGGHFHIFKVKFKLILVLIGQRTKKIARIGVTLILFAGLGFGRCFGQGAHVRTSTNFISPHNTTTNPVTFAGASTAGNLIVVAITYSGTAINVTGVADTKGNAYAKINGPTNWNGATFRSELWYAFNIIGGAPATTEIGVTIILIQDF